MDNICKKCQKTEIVSLESGLCHICFIESWIKDIDDMIDRIKRDGSSDEFGNPAPEYETNELLGDMKRWRLQLALLISQLEQNQRQYEDDVKQRSNHG